MLLALRNDARFYEGGKVVDVAGVGKARPPASASRNNRAMRWRPSPRISPLT